MMRGESPAHRALHTVWGGGAVGLAVGLSLWVIARSRAKGLPPAVRAEVGRAPAVLGGLIGGVSHQCPSPRSPGRHVLVLPPARRGQMPRISEFYGILIYMYYRDHLPPHIHALYAGREAKVEIVEGDVLDTRGAAEPEVGSRAI
jgi:hypothetical protein